MVLRPVLKLEVGNPFHPLRILLAAVQGVIASGEAAWQSIPAKRFTRGMRLVVGRARQSVRKLLKFSLIAFIQLIVLLVVTSIAGVLIGRWYLTRDLTAEERADLHRVMREPVEIPPEWQDVQPFAEEVIEAGKSLHSRWGFLTDSEHLTEMSGLLGTADSGEVLDATHWVRVRRLVQEQQGLESTVSNLVSLPGYELEAFPSWDLELPGHYPHLLLALVIYERLCIESIVFSEEKRWKSAFADCVTCLRMARRHPASDVLIHSWALNLQMVVSECVADIAADCEDPAPLKSLLSEMNQLDGQINLAVFGDVRPLFFVAGLRSYARMSRPVQLTSGQPLVFYMKQYFEGPSPVSDEDKPFPLKAIETLPGFSGLSDLIRCIAISQLAMPSDEDMRTIESCAKAQYDLARLTVAARIHELETGKPVESVDDLVPRYFAEPLTDPFSEETYRRNAEEHRFYSVGPDETDNGGAVLYDTSNGTISAGDIYVQH